MNGDDRLPVYLRTGFASCLENSSVPPADTKCNLPEASPMTTHDAVAFHAAHSAEHPSSSETVEGARLGLEAETAEITRQIGTRNRVKRVHDARLNEHVTTAKEGVTPF